MKVISIIILLFSFSAFAWQENLKNRIQEIDRQFEGEIGVVIKNLNDGSSVEYNADKSWYLSSTMKVIVAISVLEEVEKGSIKLNQKLTLKEEDFVDGAGKVLWSKPGAQFTVSTLLEAMIRESDNTATDMLINLVGAEEFNRDFKRLLRGAGDATTLLEVRYLAYTELHPLARSLTNMDFILLKNTPLEKRHAEFAGKIRVPVKNLKALNLEEAHEKYYTKGYNSAPLQSYVDLLEELERGKILSKENTRLLLSHMENMSTGDHRIKAGLTPDLKFVQKTGTQIHRACNVGLIKKSPQGKADLALAICLSKPIEAIDSDHVFEKLGKEIAYISGQLIRSH